MPDLESLLDQVDEMRDEIVSLEQDMVRLPTVHTGVLPTGNETELCRYIEKWLAEDGIESETIESAPDRGNLIARLDGRSGEAGLMFMSHLDVVPVEDEEKWRFLHLAPPWPTAGCLAGAPPTAKPCSPANCSPCGCSSATISS